MFSLSRLAILPAQEADAMDDFLRLLQEQEFAVVIGLQGTGEVAFRQVRVSKNRLSYENPFSLAR